MLLPCPGLVNHEFKVGLTSNGETNEKATPPKTKPTAISQASPLDVWQTDLVLMESPSGKKPKRGNATTRMRV